MILSIFILVAVVLAVWILNRFINERFWRNWEMNPFNFAFRWFGRKLWYSRSNAVVGCVFYEDDSGDVFVLANKRGAGTPDHQGKWNAPCGYLEWNESCEQAVAREVREETGVYIPSDEFTLVSVNSDPTADDRQNVVHRYGIIISKERALSFNLNNRDSEKDEVEDITFINLSALGAYEWAFNHREIIPRVYSNLKRIEQFYKFESNS